MSRRAFARRLVWSGLGRRAPRFVSRFTQRHRGRAVHGRQHSVYFSTGSNVGVLIALGGFMCPCARVCVYACHLIPCWNP